MFPTDLQQRELGPTRSDAACLSQTGPHVSCARGILGAKDQGEMPVM